MIMNNRGSREYRRTTSSSSLSAKRRSSERICDNCGCSSDNNLDTSNHSIASCSSNNSSNSNNSNISDSCRNNNNNNNNNKEPSSTTSSSSNTTATKSLTPRPTKMSTAAATSSTSIASTSNASSPCADRPETSFVSRRSESCTDLNGNSRINTNNNNNSNNHNDNSRRAPSIASLSKNVSTVRPFSVSVDTPTSGQCPSSCSPQGGGGGERCHVSSECVKQPPVLYLTPLQRKERELKEMKKEIARLYSELSQKDERIFQLGVQLEEQARDFQDELDRKIAEIQELMEEKDRLTEEAREEKTSMESELSKMDQLFTDLKVKQKLQEDQFQERYLDMYKRGQKAAMFEREQELEMIASTAKHPKVTVRELTRKLSMTESELAKWQSLRLDETYKSAEKPLTDADVTLSFLKDSFYHFICDKEDCLRHFRAIVEIFRYTDAQMAKIRKTVAESKDFSRLFKKEIG